MAEDPGGEQNKRASDYGNVISALRLEPEIRHLEQSIAGWIGACNPEMHETLRWQFFGPAKYFKPLTVFSCYRGTHHNGIGEEERLSAFAVELIHNMTLIVDDILDKSRYRRKKQTLHCRFGTLPALMTSGFIVSAATSAAFNHRKHQTPMPAPFGATSPAVRSDICAECNRVVERS